jgi:isocitrate lyase
MSDLLPPIEKDTDDWNHPRWKGVDRPYTQEDVRKLRGSIRIEYTLADKASRRLWRAMDDKPFVRSLGALTGGQAVQMARAGLEAIYCSGWQVAADANSAAQTFPDQSLYPADSVPKLVKRINNALLRADQIDSVDGVERMDYLIPIVADAEAGFGGPLNAFEMMKNMIEAGAAGVHFEDQLSSEKKCGHLGGKVLVPTQQFLRSLIAARLAADVCGVPTVLIARTDADSAKLLTSDVDPRDQPFCTGERSAEGFYYVKHGMESCIARAKSYAPIADLIWMETSTPNLDQAKTFAESVLKDFPDKKLAYNCSPSFNWKKNLDDATIAKFQKELGAMGYKFQFVTLAGFHMLNYSSFMLAADYNERGMSAYSALQEQEFDAEPMGYTATKHQHEVGTGYFDKVTTLVSGGASSTTALTGSTEEAQF